MTHGSPRTFVIEDELHCEIIGEFVAKSDAVDMLKRLAQAPWDEQPNCAPCMSWKTCGREYVLIEYDTASEPWDELSRSGALNISAAKVEWLLPST